MSIGVAGSLLLWKSLYIPSGLTVVGYIFLSKVMAPSSIHLDSVLKKSQRAISETVVKCLCETHALAGEVSS